MKTCVKGFLLVTALLGLPLRRLQEKEGQLIFLRNMEDDTREKQERERMGEKGFAFAL